MEKVIRTSQNSRFIFSDAQIEIYKICDCFLCFFIFLDMQNVKKSLELHRIRDFNTKTLVKFVLFVMHFRATKRIGLVFV